MFVKLRVRAGQGALCFGCFIKHADKDDRSSIPVISVLVTTNAQLYAKLFLKQQEGKALVVNSSSTVKFNSATRCLCCSGGGSKGS